MSNNRRRPKQRQDVHTATGAPRRFSFTHEGKRHFLPDAQQAMNKVEAGVLIDAAVNGDSGEMQLGLAIVAAAVDDIEPAALAALRKKNIVEFGRIIGSWMQSAGVDAGESERSSS